MSWLDGLAHQLRTLLRPGAYDAELEEELRLHHELDAMQQGDPQRARRRFGNRTWYQEETRRMTWLGTLDVARQDLGTAWRGMRRASGLTAMIALTLTLGIGANAAMFTLLDRLYLRPPAGVTDPATLRRWWVRHFNTQDRVPIYAQALNYPMVRAIGRATGDTAGLAVYTTERLTLGHALGAPEARGVYASANYFPVLGVRLEAGRPYTGAEDRLGSGASVAVVSHAFARDRLGGAAAAVGRTVTIGRAIFTVIGVLDPHFTGLDLQPADIWIPLGTMQTPSWMQGSWWESPNIYSLRTVQRQRPGVDGRAAAMRATQYLRATNRELDRFPDTLMTATTGGIVEAQGPGEPGQELVIATRLGGVAVIVLMIAGANVMNLLLARALRRRREIAVRLALGISRARLVRVLTLESLLVAAIAAACAVPAAAWGGATLRALLLPNITWARPPVDGRVALFTAAVALLAGLVAGVVPALQASRPDLTSALKEGARDGARHGARLRGSLVGIQAAFSVVLLVGAALFVRSLRNVQALDIGYDARRLLFAGARFAEGETPPGATLNQRMRELEERLAGRPGIEAVARSGLEPMQGFSFVTFYTGADSSSSASLRARTPMVAPVSPGFFRAAGVRMLRGPGFSGAAGDRPTREVVVNEAAASLLWPGRDAMGQCVRFVKRDQPCHTVVGVVENVRLVRVIEPEAAAQMYLPLGDSSMPWAGGTLVVRTLPHGEAAASAELRAALRASFPAGEPFVTLMTKNLEPEYRPWRLGASLFTAFGLLALVVSVVGIYSTVSYTVSQRTHEFGVRIALGARTTDVLRHVVARALRPVAVGAALGVALALAAGRLVASLLYGERPWDPAVLAVVAAALLVAAVPAALGPAWRASRVDPVSALRSE